MAERPNLGEVIAERALTFTRADGSTEAVTVRIGKPAVGTSPDEWRCPYQIVGLGRVRTFALSGVDSMQALLLTLQVILPDGTFTWLDDANPGFPDYRLR